MSLCIFAGFNCRRWCGVLVSFCLAQHGSTALMYASQGGHLDCVRLLVDAGADKDAEDNVRDAIFKFEWNALVYMHICGRFSFDVNDCTFKTVNSFTPVFC